MAFPLSVIICSHNPRADYFCRTLEALRNQTLATNHWELVVVDNRSTKPLEVCIDLSWHSNAHVLREETLGLTPARLRGIEAASGELLVFVDDDNVLDANYLEMALAISAERPWLGAWSGQCRGEFEEQPPKWTRRYWGNLVIREFDHDVWSNLPRLPQTMPCGAGMVVRSSVARYYLAQNKTDARRRQLDRTGDSMLSGGDNDLAACACDLGLGIGLVASLKLAHLISPGRFTEDYISKLTEGIYTSSVLLAHVWGDKAELASYQVRPHHWLRALTNRGPHRKIQLAALRGRRKGLALVKLLGAAEN